MRIDGLLRSILVVPKNLQGTVTSRLKVMGGMDISERKIPQDGRANVRVKNGDMDLRMSTIPTIHGEKIVIRLLDKSSQILTPKGLGLEGAELEKFKMLLSYKNGVVLLTGPTGSGKSSTMATMVRLLNKDEVNICLLYTSRCV